MLGRHMYVHYRRPVETLGRIAVCSLEALGRAHLRRWQCGSKPVILDYVEWAHSGLFTSSRLVHPGPPNELGFLHSKPLGSHGNQPLVTVFVPRVFPRSPPIIDIILASLWSLNTLVWLWCLYLAPSLLRFGSLFWTLDSAQGSV